MRKYNTIFIRILCLTLPTVLIISIIIGASCLKLSEGLLLKEVITIANRNLIQVQNKLLDYNSHIAVAMSKISTSKEFKNYITAVNPSTLEQIELVTNLGHYMDTYREYLTPDESYFIVSGQGKEFNRYYSSNPSKWDVLPDQFVEKYMTLGNNIPNKMIYHADRNAFSDTSPFTHNIFVTKPLIDSKTGVYGYVVLVLDEEYIASTYSDYITNGMTISVIDSNGQVLSSSDKERLFTQNQNLVEKAKKISDYSMSELNVMQDNQNTILALYLPFYDAYLIEEINQQIVFASLYSLGNYMIMVILIVLFVTGIIVFIVCKNITKPLSYLASNMAFTATHDFKGPMIKPQGSNEVKLITQAYNTMLDDINEHVKHLISEQEQRRKAELSALQMQINPHFLYNTLSSIKYLAKQQRILEVDETIHSLISILQNVMGTADELTTIRKEIENLNYFIYINQVRYGDGIKVNYHIAEDCYGLIIPKLIIQPFIENSFFHGFAGMNSGNINVFINKNDDLLLIEILDNGHGMDCSKDVTTQKKYHFTGIGINNVDERIRLLYGESYGIEVQSEVGSGTSIMIHLPAINEVSSTNH